MRRRDMLKLSAGAAMLAAPHIVRAERERTLKFVPIPDLTSLDPVGSPNRASHNHGYLVFDTLYGLDETFTAQPQMAEGHTVENKGTLWTMRLREGLRFHDGTPVLARDAVASIRRFAARDAFGKSLMAVTSELSAPDDRTVRFHLTKPFPHLLAALAGSSTTMPCIMPERLAATDPFRQVTEIVGSGPYRFLPAEFNSGVRSAYERFVEYVPRSEGTQSYTAGPKVAHFDRVEWRSIGDAASRSPRYCRVKLIGWIHQAPIRCRCSCETPASRWRSGNSLDQLRPCASTIFLTFDNPAIRRALLGAIDQADVMNAVAGTDRTYWHDRIGLFDPSSPLANQAGIERISGPRDYDKVKRDLKEAGYRGEPIVVLGVSGNSYNVSISQVGSDQLRKAGMNVDLQIMDFGTLVRRRMSKEPPEKGGWNIFFTILDGLFNDTPATNYAIRGDRKSGLEGWPDSPKLEALREAWLNAQDANAQRQIGVQMQLQMWQDVPYIPMGHWVRSTAHRRNIVDLPWGFAAFYGVRRV